MNGRREGIEPRGYVTRRVTAQPPPRRTRLAASAYRSPPPDLVFEVRRVSTHAYPGDVRLSGGIARR